MSARIKRRSPDPEAGQSGLPGVRVTVVSACHPRDSKRPPRKILLAQKGLPACNLESTTPAQKKTAQEAVLRPSHHVEPSGYQGLRAIGRLSLNPCRAVYRPGHDSFWAPRARRV